MAEIDSSGGGGKDKGGKKKGKKLSTRVDFTPMVDLGFLLITFFMLTTSMNKPQTMEINMPIKDDEQTEKTDIKASQAITLLLATDNKIAYYFVNAETGEAMQPEITAHGKGGIRKVLIEENKKRNPNVDSLNVYKSQFSKGQITEDFYMERVKEIKSFKDGLIVVIKASDKAKYENLIDILDEMSINNIGRFAVVDITPADIEILKEINLE